MKLTTKKLKELIKEEMSNMDVDPYASNQEAPENVWVRKKMKMETSFITEEKMVFFGHHRNHLMIKK